MKFEIVAALLISFSQVQAVLAAPPSPGEGLPPGGELSRSGDKYDDPKKEFWGDDAIGRACKHATDNTADFLTKMWAQYGSKAANEATWQTSLRKAIEFAKSDNWKSAASESESCIAENPNAIDAKLLRAVAYTRLNQPEKAHGNLMSGNRFLDGHAKVGPVADKVSKQFSR